MTRFAMNKRLAKPSRRVDDLLNGWRKESCTNNACRKEKRRKNVRDGFIKLRKRNVSTGGLYRLKLGCD